jgi:hypothetical protein
LVTRPRCGSFTAPIFQTQTPPPQKPAAQPTTLEYRMKKLGIERKR